MYIKLKLYLKRYGLIWTLENIYQEWKELNTKIDNIEDLTLKQEVNLIMDKLVREFMKFFHYLRSIED